MPLLPIINQRLLIEKRAVQSGFAMSNWTYIVIPDFPATLKNDGPRACVKGFIDAFEVQRLKLLPMKEGSMMLPINAKIRKEIGKNVGDWVQVVLYPDDTVFVVPDDILACLIDSPRAAHFFHSLSESNQRYYVEWVESTKNLDTKAARILKMIERLEQGIRFYDWKKD
jgi:uncharacterized protein YdeI (YjbR/CyaY-like superfamily)